MVVISTGPGNNGVAFHKHGTAWLVLNQGMKRWWLYPPGGPPTQDAYDRVALCPSWKLPERIASLPPEVRPIEIVQRPGEGVFVPALWWHATFDEEPTLGVGSQFSMADLDIMRCYAEYPDSAFVLYHVACEIHKSDEAGAVALFEEAIAKEPLNFYFRTNQLLFYLNMVVHPAKTLAIICELMDAVTSRLDERRQMIVQRFVIPSICNFVEWHAPHDRLLKYCTRAMEVTWNALESLAKPMLPGGDRFRLSNVLPYLGDLEYVANCCQCLRTALGKAGQPGSIRAHKFFCFQCSEALAKAVCSGCGTCGGEGQMGHPGTEYASHWYCARCWSAWKASCSGIASQPVAVSSSVQSSTELETFSDPEKEIPSDVHVTVSSLQSKEEICWVLVD